MYWSYSNRPTNHRYTSRDALVDRFYQIACLVQSLNTTDEMVCDLRPVQQLELPTNFVATGHFLTRSTGPVNVLLSEVWCILLLFNRWGTYCWWEFTLGWLELRS
jgi:hypothetical protein